MEHIKEIIERNVDRYTPDESFRLRYNGRTMTELKVYLEERLSKREKKLKRLRKELLDKQVR